MWPARWQEIVCLAARAPMAQRLASLIGTGQLDVAVLDTADAIAMLNGSGQFEPYGPISIRQIARAGGRLLVAHERLPAKHAWLIAATLDQTRTIDMSKPNLDPDISWHAGALSYLNGKPQPGAGLGRILGVSGYGPLLPLAPLELRRIAASRNGHSYKVAEMSAL